LAFREVPVGAALRVVFPFLLPLGERPLVDTLAVLLTFGEVAARADLRVMFALFLALREAAFMFFLVLVLVMRH
jgi:hypothetical protein